MDEGMTSTVVYSSAVTMASNVSWWMTHDAVEMQTSFAWARYNVISRPSSEMRLTRILPFKIKIIPRHAELLLLAIWSLLKRLVMARWDTIAFSSDERFAQNGIFGKIWVMGGAIGFVVMDVPL